ncbi:hypothetical protein PHYC_01741 [Phycisphaerales bacterium]|nr:hypothetical protein PHYC_01741 [Phycisphaerales bacterium]
MYERKHEPLLHRRGFYRRVARHTGFVGILVVPSLVIGVLGFHFIEGWGWLDSLLESSMLLGGMGPTQVPETTAGKIFGSIYALFCGLVLLTAAAVILTPFVHRVLHRFHADESGAREKSGGEHRRAPHRDAHKKQP